MKRNAIALVLALSATVAVGACSKKDNTADTGAAAGSTGGMTDTAAMRTDTMGGMTDTMHHDTTRHDTTATKRP